MIKRSEQDKAVRRASKLRLYAFDNRVSLTDIGKKLGLTATAIYHRFCRGAKLDEVERVINEIIAERASNMKEAS